MHRGRGEYGRAYLSSATRVVLATFSCCCAALISLLLTRGRRAKVRATKGVSVDLDWSWVGGGGERGPRLLPKGRLQEGVHMWGAQRFPLQGE
jgi:hypothetical protein